jgi:DNA-binding XRE family transcriptional regulator
MVRRSRIEPGEPVEIDGRVPGATFLEDLCELFDERRLARAVRSRDEDRLGFGSTGHRLTLPPTTRQRITMFGDLLCRDRERASLSPEQAARRFGVSRAPYRALEAGERWPEWETYDRICKTFGWPQTLRGPERGWLGWQRHYPTDPLCPHRDGRPAHRGNDRRSDLGRHERSRRCDCRGYEHRGWRGDPSPSDRARGGPSETELVSGRQ